MQNQNQNNCPICGGRSYIWGVARGHDYLKFKTEESAFWEKLSPYGGETTQARKCNDCGNLQLFVTEE